MSSVLALDLARRTGWATHDRGGTIASGVWQLREGSDAPGVMYAALERHLELVVPRMDHVVCEAPMRLQAFLKLRNSQEAVEQAYGLVAIVRAQCVREHVPLKLITPQTARRHFIGKAHGGSREVTKQLVVRQAQLEGLMPRDSTDDNRADACAVLSWMLGMLRIQRLVKNELRLFA